MMYTIFIAGGVFLFALMLPIFYRVIKGPTAIDRVVAVNMIGTKTVVLLLIIGVLFGNLPMFVDFALAYALLNFLGSLAAARFIHQARIRSTQSHPMMPIDPEAILESISAEEAS